MEASVRKIGNSRGIIIPAPILAACDIQDKVEIEISGSNLIMHRPLERRKGWYDGFVEDDDETIEAKQWDATSQDTEDWEW